MQNQLGSIINLITKHVKKPSWCSQLDIAVEFAFSCYDQVFPYLDVLENFVYENRQNLKFVHNLHFQRWPMTDFGWDKMDDTIAMIQFETNATNFYFLFKIV